MYTPQSSTKFNIKVIQIQIQIQKCSLDRNVTSATYKLVFSNVLHTYKVIMNNNNNQKNNS